MRFAIVFGLKTQKSNYVLSYATTYIEILIVNISRWHLKCWNIFNIGFNPNSMKMCLFRFFALYFGCFFSILTFFFVSGFPSAQNKHSFVFCKVWLNIGNDTCTINTTRINDINNNYNVICLFTQRLHTGTKCHFTITNGETLSFRKYHGFD